MDLARLEASRRTGETEKVRTVSRHREVVRLSEASEMVPEKTARRRVRADATERGRPRAHGMRRALVKRQPVKTAEIKEVKTARKTQLHPEKKAAARASCSALGHGSS